MYNNYTIFSSKPLANINIHKCICICQTSISQIELSIIRHNSHTSRRRSLVTYTIDIMVSVILVFFFLLLSNLNNKFIIFSVTTRSNSQLNYRMPNVIFRDVIKLRDLKLFNKFQSNKIMKIFQIENWSKITQTHKIKKRFTTKIKMSIICLKCGVQLHAVCPLDYLSDWRILTYISENWKRKLKWQQNINQFNITHTYIHHVFIHINFNMMLIFTKLNSNGIFLYFCL